MNLIGENYYKERKKIKKQVCNLNISSRLYQLKVIQVFLKFSAHFPNQITYPTHPAHNSELLSALYDIVLYCIVQYYVGHQPAGSY